MDRPAVAGLSSARQVPRDPCPTSNAKSLAFRPHRTDRLTELHRDAPEAALVASRFESRATEIDGVELELLVHPSHTQNLEVFEDENGQTEVIRTDNGLLNDARQLFFKINYLFQF